MADREKQIEEMAKVVEKMPWRIVQDWRGTRISNNTEIAKYFYNEGYRKQRFGRWEISKIGDGGTTRTCSNCHISQTVNVYNGKVMFKYCPYCGAKMKAGESDV